jgi:4-amino-4-deoxy-L-arabinose transferase-like glycosyltransferase
MVAPNDLGPHPNSKRTWSPALVGAFILATLSLFIAPNGFGGGRFDDQRYLEAARAWVTSPPLIGETHWELRHTLTLPLAAWFGIGGESLAPFHLIPAAAWASLLALTMLALGRTASHRAAIIFAAVFATTQLFHQFGTRYYPEVFELLFVAASLWCFYLGSRSEPRRRWLLLAGAAASLAMVTRETSWFLPLVYAAFLLAGKPVSRSSMLWVVAGAAPFLIGETLWFWVATGDPLHRAHVALNHVTIPTDQMEGLVYEGEGGVLFNPAIGSRWKDVGTFNVHWTINPILNLFADMRYGLLFWLAAGLGLLARRERADMPLPLGAIGAIGVIGLFSFAFMNYVLMLPQRTRYYGLLAYCAALIVAVLADRLLLQRGRRRLFAALAAIQLALGFVLIGTLRSDEALADISLPLIAAAPGQVYTDPATLAQLSFPLEAAGLRDKVAAGTPPPGGLELQVFERGRPTVPGRTCCWRVIATAEPRPNPLVAIWRLFGGSHSRKPAALGVTVRRRSARPES